MLLAVQKSIASTGDSPILKSFIYLSPKRGCHCSDILFLLFYCLIEIIYGTLIIIQEFIKMHINRKL